MTAADLERANLLTRPGSALSAAAGVVYFLVFKKSLGPLSDDDILDWVESRGLVAVLPPIAHNDTAVGVCVKVKSGAQRTVQDAFVGLAGAPGFAQADLTLKFAVQGTDPRTLGNYAVAAQQSDVFNDGILDTIGRKAREIIPQLPNVKSLGTWVVVVLVLVALILIVPRLIGTKD